jgi:uncharacterized protein YbjT (DUF2867 family)
MKRTLVIGGTGTVGTQVVSQLLDRGLPVRVLARNPQKARFPTQVELVGGDLSAPESLDAGLQDIGAVFLVWTAPPTAAVPALERITRKARRIVFLSAPLKTPHPLFQQPNLARNLGLQIEQLIESSGIPRTFLRPGMFAANSKEWWGDQIREGSIVRWPYLDVPTAPIDERDIAAVAVRALTESGHDGAEYVITGPQSLTHLEQISTIGEVLGRSLTIQELSPEDARRDLLPAFPRPVVNMLLDAWAAAAGQPAFVSSTFQQILGRPPRTFREWARDNAVAFLH